MGMFGKMKNWFLTDEAKERAAREREEQAETESGSEVVDAVSAEDGTPEEVEQASDKKKVKKVVKKKVVKKVVKSDDSEEDAEEMERKRVAFEAEQEEIRRSTEARRQEILGREEKASSGGHSIEEIRRRLQELSGEPVVVTSDAVSDADSESVESSTESVESSTGSEDSIAEVEAVVSPKVSEDADEIVDAFQARLAREREEARKKELVLKKQAEEEKYYLIMMDLPPRSTTDEMIVDALGAGIPEWYLREQGIMVDDADAFKDVSSKVVVGIDEIRKNAGLTTEVPKTIVEFDASSAAKLAETLGSAVPTPVVVQSPVVPLAEQVVEFEPEADDARLFDVSESGMEVVEIEDTAVVVESEVVEEVVEAEVVAEAEVVEAIEEVVEAVEAVEVTEELTTADSIETVSDEGPVEEAIVAEDAVTGEEAVEADEAVRVYDVGEDAISVDVSEEEEVSEVVDADESFDIAEEESVVVPETLDEEDTVDVDEVEELVSDVVDATASVDVDVEDVEQEVEVVPVADVSKESVTESDTEAFERSEEAETPAESNSLSSRLQNLAKSLIKREVLNVNKESNEVLVKESIKDNLGVLRAKYSNYKVAEEHSETIEVGKDLADDVTLEEVESKMVIDGDDYSVSAEEEASILDTYSVREIWVITTDESLVTRANEALRDSRYHVNRLANAKDFLIATRSADNLVVITQLIPDDVKASLSGYLKHLNTSGLKGRFASVKESLVNASIIETVFEEMAVEALDAYYVEHPRVAYERKVSSLIDLMKMADFDISDALRENADIEVSEEVVEGELVYEELILDDGTIELDSSEGEEGIYYTDYGDIDLGKILDN